MTEAFPEPTLSEFVWIWNRMEGRALPAIHARILAWLEGHLAGWPADGRPRRLLLMAFRNSGKSTLLALFAVWLLLRDAERRILVVSAEQSLAEKLVADARRILTRHPLTRRLRPGRRKAMGATAGTDRAWAADRVTVRRRRGGRDPSILARGLGANLTGAHADLVLCDDVEVPNTCDSPGRRVELRRRLTELDYVLEPGGATLYAGTPHAHASIYAREARAEEKEERPFLAGFARLELPLLDADGDSAWPERFPAAAIEAIRRKAGPLTFASQMMLQAVAPGEGRLDPDRLRRYGEEIERREANGALGLWLGGRRLVSASAWWDPSFGAPSRGDASVLAAVFADGEGRLYLHRIAYLTHDPHSERDEATQLCRQVAAIVEELRLPAVRVETNGLSRFLPGLLRTALRGRGLATAVVEMNAHLPKARRILEGFDARLAAGTLWAHDSVWRTPFIREMREWRPDGHGADDGLDAVAGCLLAEPVRIAAHGHGRPPPRPADWRPGQPQSAADTAFRP